MTSLSNSRLITLQTYKIAPNPLQPRRRFDPEKLRELSESISGHGLLQPIAVRRVSGGYELVAGERRLRAAKMAGLTRISCILVSADSLESGILALAENMQREELDFFEQAEGIRAVMESGSLSQSEAAALLGKSQPAVANKLRLLYLSNPLREKICAAGLTERHARALLALPDDSAREIALGKIISANLNVAASERLIESMLRETAPKRRIHGAIRDLRAFDNSLRNAVSLLGRCGITSKIDCREEADRVEYTIIIRRTG